MARLFSYFCIAALGTIVVVSAPGTAQGLERQSPTAAQRVTMAEPPTMPPVAKSDVIQIKFLYDPVTCPIPLVMAHVNGRPKPYAFAIDTGSQVSAVNADLAADLGIEPVLGETLTGVGKTAGFHHIDVLNDPRSASAKPVLMIVRRAKQSQFLPLSQVPAPKIGGKSGFAGLLGMDAFANYTMRFDFGRNTLTLYPGPAPQTQSTVSQPAVTLPMVQATSNPSPHVQFSGGDKDVRIPMLIDTGANSSVAMQSDAQKLTPHTDSPLTRPAMSVYGYQELTTLLLPALRIGGLVEPNVEMSNEPPNMDNPSEPSRLGMNVLSRFIMVIDPYRYQVTFQRLPDYSKHLWQLGISSVVIASDHGVPKVQSVTPGTNAMAAGIPWGTTVLSIDGYKVAYTRDTGSSVQSRVDGLAGTIATLEVEVKGKPVTFKYQRENAFLLVIGDPNITHGHLGLSVGVLSETRQYLIDSVEPGGPADRAGVKVNDILLAVDGIDVTGKSLTEVSTHIQKPVGSTLKFKIQPADHTRPPHEITVTLAKPPTD